MTKYIVLWVFLLGFNSFNTTLPPEQYITRQGQVSFFSYTSVENIEAKNNQVLSILDPQKGEIAVSMLMNGFQFKKSLMRMHFNESYIESDLYPKATFEGTIPNFDITEGEQVTRLIKGKLTIRDIQKEVTIKTLIKHPDTQTYIFEGTFDIAIKDFAIKVPALLAPNIAKTIAIKTRFEYSPYEK